MSGATLLEAQCALAAGIRAEGEPAAALALLRPLRGGLPRLDVYQQAWRSRLLAALRSNFPVLHPVMGDEAFEALAMAYLAAHPPQKPSIRWLGDELAGFMAGSGEALVPHPALVDLARLEWALGSSFDSADAPTWAPAGFQAPSAGPDGQALAEQALSAHPSLRLLALDWAVGPIWHAVHLQLDAAPDDNTDSAEPPEPLAQAHTVLVWRQGLDSRWRILAEDEAALLGALLAGASLAGLGEVAAQRLPADQAAAWLAAVLRRWLDDGLLSRPALTT